MWWKQGSDVVKTRIIRDVNKDQTWCKQGSDMVKTKFKHIMHVQTEQDCENS